MLAKSSELLFVEAMRRYAESMPPGGKGWLAGVRDPQIGHALALLHAEPDRTWTVDDLARQVALSRSALAERFAALVGEPPIQYLMRWRLALAAQALRSAGDAIAHVAAQTGYEFAYRLQPGVQTGVRDAARGLAAPGDTFATPTSGKQAR